MRADKLGKSRPLRKLTLSYKIPHGRHGNFYTV